MTTCYVPLGSRELVLRKFLQEQARVKLHARDLELLNGAADELNAEAEDVLGYQAHPTVLG